MLYGQASTAPAIERYKACGGNIPTKEVSKGAISTQARSASEGTVFTR